MNSAPWTGHCGCGAVRYQAASEPLHVSLCHCEDCQRASGSPFQGWVFFAKRDITFLCGELRIYAYEGRERTFCGHCGSPISFFDAALPDLMELSLGTMDRASELPARDHNWMDDHWPWVVLDHALPKFPQNAPAPCLT
jgi:hypothetical protein